MDAQFASYRRNNKNDIPKTLSGIPRHKLLGPKRNRRFNKNKEDEGKSGTFSCNICGKVLKHRDSMVRHRREEHGIHKRRGRGGKESLADRAVADHGTRAHVCQLCGAAYNHKCSLSRHRGLVHKDSTSLKAPNPVKKKRVFDCRSCNVSFRSYSSFWAHRKIHAAVTQKKRTKLKEIGNQSTSVKTTRKIHSTKNQKIHVTKNCHTRKQQSVECDICGRMLVNAGSLVRHRKVHTQDKPHKCETCGATFAERFNLKHHLKTHTGRLHGSLTI